MALSPIIQAIDIEKDFGITRALRGVSLSVIPGEVHGLIGANGAGKSTLVNCLAGRIRPDSGEILIDGAPVRIDGPQQANQLGMSFIFQELAFAPRLTVLENLSLGVWTRNRLGLIDWRSLRVRATAVAERLQLDFGLNRSVQSLSVAQRGMLSIARALMHDARMIAMDEPTASLSSAEADKLFEIIRDLRSDGVGIIYISHRLKEIEDLCDRVTLFKDGQDIARLGPGEFSESSLLELMAGPTTEPPERADSVGARPVVLQVRDLTRAPAFESINFNLHRGEILGLGGLVGAGRTEILRTIFGAEKATSGSVLVDGKDLPRGSVVAAMRAGVALVPEERRSQGLVMRKSVQWNIALPSWNQLLRKPFPLISRSKMRERAEKYVSAISIKTGNVAESVDHLSGGNQQKVVLAKWLARDPKVLLLDEPSRGVDVAARREIFDLIRDMAARGVAVVLVSSELEELAICDRVLVVREGSLVGEISHMQGISEASILRLAFANKEN